MLDRAGYVDLVSSHLIEPGWVGTMIDWILNPPAGIFLPAIAIGLAFIYWDNRRGRAQSKKPQSGGLSIDAGFVQRAASTSLYMTSVQVIFTNKTNGVINLYWLKPDGDIALFARISQHGLFQVTTYPNQSWSARDATGFELLRYAVNGDEVQNVTIIKQLHS